MNGRLAGLQDSRRKIARLPDYPEDALLDSLDALGIPTDLRQDYLSLQLTALPGLGRLHQVAGGRAGLPLAAGLSGRSGEVPRHSSLVCP